MTENETATWDAKCLAEYARLNAIAAAADRAWEDDEECEAEEARAAAERAAFSALYE